MAESAPPLSESSPPFAAGRRGPLAIWVLLRISAAIAAPIWVLGFLWAGMHREVVELLSLLVGLPCLLVFAFAPRTIWRHRVWQLAVIAFAVVAIAAQLVAIAKFGVTYGFSELAPVVFRVVVLFALLGLLFEAVSWKVRESSHA